MFWVLDTKVIAFNEGNFGDKSGYKSAVNAHLIFFSGKKQFFRTNWDNFKVVFGTKIDKNMTECLILEKNYNHQHFSSNNLFN